MANKVLRINQRAKAIAAMLAWVFCWILFTASDIGNAERLLKTTEPGHIVEKEMRQGFLVRLLHFFWQTGKSSYQHVWPEMEFGWRPVVGTLVGFLGAAFEMASVGGVGAGGGSIVPFFSSIIGFDPKSSSSAISKCTSTKALFKGLETCKKESTIKMEAAELLESDSKPNTTYFVLVGIIAAFADQHVVRRVIAILGRASIIILVFARTILVSSIRLALQVGLSLARIIEKLETNEVVGI